MSRINAAVNLLSIGASLYGLYQLSNRKSNAQDRIDEMDKRYWLLRNQITELERELRSWNSSACSVVALQEQIEELIRRLERLVEPKCLPTHAAIESAKRRIKYQSGYFHIAVAGPSGTGKSSIINALRVLMNIEPGAAPVGYNETTAEITRYPPVDPKSKMFLYDIPGAGTLKVPRWEYFKSHLLYVFDAIILCSASRFYDTDFAILQHAANLNIRCFVIRSKCDEELRSIRDNIKDCLMVENICRADPHYEREFKACCDKEVARFRVDCQNVLDDSCETENLPRQRLFLLSHRCLYSVLRASREGQICVPEEDADNNFLDEELFLQELAEWVISESEVVNEFVGVGDRGSATASNETRAMTSGQAASATQDSDEKKTVDAPTATGCHVLLPSQLSAESLKAKRLDLQRLATTVTPSAAKLAYIAVVGSTGAGKSSLINSIRGLRKKDQSAAPLETFDLQECERSTSLAVFPGADLPVIYFEVPGFEYLDCVPEEFFTAQSLYAFDVVVLLWDSGLADTEVSIVGSCLSWGIPIMLVRSKADAALLSKAFYMRGAQTSGMKKLKDALRCSTEQTLFDSLKGVPGYDVNSKTDLLKSFVLNEHSLGDVVREKRDGCGLKMDEEEFLKNLQHHCDIRKSNTIESPSSLA